MSCKLVLLSSQLNEQNYFLKKRGRKIAKCRINSFNIGGKCMFVISDIIKSIGMDIQYLFSILKKSNWLAENGTGVSYSFLNLELAGNVLSGMVYLGDKLLDFELSFQDIMYNTFRIDKYTFLVKSSDAITVFVDGDESNTVPLVKMSNLK